MKNKNFKLRQGKIFYHKLANKEYMHYCMIVNIKKIYGGKELECKELFKVCHKVLEGNKY
jgi:hypothetical protein